MEESLTATLPTPIAPAEALSVEQKRVRWLVVAACALITSASLIQPPLHQLVAPFPPTAFNAGWTRF